MFTKKPLKNDTVVLNVVAKYGKIQPLSLSKALTNQSNTNEAELLHLWPDTGICLSFPHVSSKWSYVFPAGYQESNTHHPFIAGTKF